MSVLVSLKNTMLKMSPLSLMLYTNTYYTTEQNMLYALYDIMW